MTGGYPCPDCGEHVRPFGQGCACQVASEPYHICPCCGRSWASAEEMREGTDHVGWMHFDGECIELANCPCGSTRAVTVRADDCPPTLRTGLPPTARDGRAGAAGDANSRE